MKHGQNLWDTLCAQERNVGKTSRGEEQGSLPNLGLKPNITSRSGIGLYFNEIHNVYIFKGYLGDI